MVNVIKKRNSRTTVLRVVYMKNKSEGGRRGYRKKTKAGDGGNSKTKEGWGLLDSVWCILHYQKPATRNPFMWFWTKEGSITYASWHAAHDTSPSA